MKAQEVQLTAEATAELQRFARTHQVTLNTVIQGAWALLLSRYSGSEDVVFGVTVSGRPASLPGVEEMVGLFINTLPVRVQVKSEERVGAYLRRFQEQQVEVRQYEYSPLADVQRWSEMGAGMRLFDTIFVFENTPLEETQSEMYGGLWISEVKYIERNNYSLTIVVIPGRNLLLQVWYDGRSHDSATTRRLLEHLQTLLGEIAANPQQKPGELSLMTEAERRQVLFEWNETTVDFPLSSCIHHLFEAQVRRSPDAVAVRSASASLTFAELDATRQPSRALPARVQHWPTVCGRAAIGPQLRNAHRYPRRAQSRLCLSAAGSVAPARPHGLRTRRCASDATDHNALFI